MKMKKLHLNKEDYGQWIVALCTILWPVAACVYSLVKAMSNGYPVKSPLLSLVAILAVAVALYYPVMRAESINQFDIKGHGLEFINRQIFGGFAMCFIAVLPEVNQMAEYGYTNYVAMVLFWIWVAVVSLILLLLVLIFGFGWGD